VTKKFDFDQCPHKRNFSLGRCHRDSQQVDVDSAEGPRCAKAVAVAGAERAVRHLFWRQRKIFLRAK
jgi:hypothetical protein